MSIRMIRYAGDGRLMWGELISNAPYSPSDVVKLRPITKAFDTTAELVHAFGAGDLPKAAPISIEASQITSPITPDATILCQGMNYWSHAEESGQSERQSNLFFMKASSAICGPYDNIIKPQNVELLDYEVEIGLVVRNGIDMPVDVTKETVGNYVAGVVLANDVSARDEMFGASFLQWFKGKSFRTFCPLGPVLYLFEPNEAPEILENLSITLKRGEAVKQQSHSSKQIYKAPETLSQSSEFLSFKSGDLILTGTPGGVIAQGTPPIAKIVLEHLFDDTTRRSELIEEFQKTDPFLQAGETLSLSLIDDKNELDLGGQLTPIENSYGKNAQHTN